MKKLSEEERRIRQYLLGALEAEESEGLEQRFLTDARLIEEVGVIENEVVADYLAGALDEQEREQFQNHFLASPARYEKLKFFSALRRNLDNLPRPLAETHLQVSWKRFLPAFLRGENPLLRYSFAAAALILFLGGMWGLVSKWPALDPGSEHPSLATITVTLAPSRKRAIGAGETVRVYLSDNTEAVKLQLPLSESGYQSYRAILVTDENVEKLTLDELQAQTQANSKMVSLSVAAKILARGDYQIKLYGRAPGGNFEELDSYPFRVIRN